ncbi:MAG: hypothetical protein IT168_20610 [Bryobacterales bacterium]|nr:hypothetical protein [Bryobacterales bacterium]
MSAPIGISRDIFINHPYGDFYEPLRIALLFTIQACGYWPRSAQERLNGLELRLEKIEYLVKNCRLSAHDVGTYPEWTHPHYNMGFELGLCFSWHRSQFSQNQEVSASCLVLLNELDQQRYFSDLAGIDVSVHGRDPLQMIEGVRSWLWRSDRPVPGVAYLKRLFREFEKELPAQLNELGHEKTSQPVFRELTGLIGSWLIIKKRELAGKKAESA